MQDLLALVQDLLPLLDITQVELFPVTFVLHAGFIVDDILPCHMLCSRVEFHHTMP